MMRFMHTPKNTAMRARTITLVNGSNTATQTRKERNCITCIAIARMTTEPEEQRTVTLSMQWLSIPMIPYSRTLKSESMRSWRSRNLPMRIISSVSSNSKTTGNHNLHFKSQTVEHRVQWFDFSFALTPIYKFHKIPYNPDKKQSLLLKKKVRYDIMAIIKFSTLDKYL